MPNAWLSRIIIALQEIAALHTSERVNLQITPDEAEQLFLLLDRRALSAPPLEEYINDRLHDHDFAVEYVRRLRQQLNEGGKDG